MLQSADDCSILNKGVLVMYEIRPESVKQFITDRNIRLPRFQRKQTWDDKKNFELCISLFKEYPLGVTIVNAEMNDGITIRWLLDGRQRRNALLKMYEDPENIYVWAKKYIKFKNNSQPDEIRELFWNMINEYVEYDDEETDDNGTAVDETDIDLTDVIDDDSISNTDISQATGLDFLLEIILMIHNKKKNTTGFTKPFDILKYVDRPRFVELVEGISVLSSRKVKSEVIDRYRDRYTTYSPEGFYEFIDSEMIINNSEGLKKHIIKNWKDILLRIKMIERLDSIITNSKIGIIEVKEIRFADSQKIFNIINTKGEKLTAVEVLSAKPSWNTTIDYNSAPQAMQEAVADFYSAMGISVDKKIVKWDLPATFLRRIGKNFIIQEFDTSKPNELSQALTYGFKLLAGIWENGIKKDDIDKLSKERNIDWLSKYESLVYELQTMLKVIETCSYFKFFKTWRTSIMELTNDSIALNFFIMAYKDWERKGKPGCSDSNAKIFAKNCFVLWDKLIYEYLASKWKGSGDSKVGKNIEELSNSDSAYKSIPAEEWIRLLEEIRDRNTVFEEKVSVKTMKPILYHFYCLKSLSGPDTSCGIEVDHILPQDAFKSLPDELREQQHSLFNLGLLPKNENISKSNKRLIEIQDNWLKDQIMKYEFISESDFVKYSDITNRNDLFSAHFELFEAVFAESGDRDRLLYN